MKAILMRILLTTTIPLCLLILPAAAPAQTEAPSKQEAEQVIPGIPNFSRYSEDAAIAFGGQPSDEALQALKESGFKTVLSLRRPEETTEDESKKVLELGMHYYNIPITPSSITDEKVQAFIRVVEDPANKPLLIHCSSSNRVGGLWYIYNALEKKLPESESLAEAKKAGLRSPDLEKTVKEYVAQKKATPPSR